jgi:hypothetical protein
MIPDPTDEIRSMRNRLAAKCNYDLDRIVEETRQHQRDSGRTYGSLDQGLAAGETTNQRMDQSGDRSSVRA